MRRAALTIAAAAYPTGLLLLTVVHVVAPQRDGIVALSQVFAPHLFLAGVPLLAGALLWRLGPATVAIATLAIAVCAVRFGPGMISLPVPLPEGQTLTVMTWNLAAGEGAAELLVERLLASDADLVALQELRPEHVAKIEAEPVLSECFPGRLLVPQRGTLGIGLLSSRPLIDATAGLDPPLIVARIQPAEDVDVTVATAHARPPRFGLLGGFLPVAYDARIRDDDLRAVRAEVGARSTDPLILLGDFNVTDREPGYTDLTDGLLDAHTDAGFGTGLATGGRRFPAVWRPAHRLRPDQRRRRPGRDRGRLPYRCGRPLHPLCHCGHY